MCDQAVSTRDDVKYTVRRATRQDVQTINIMCVEEGWEMGLDYLLTVFDLDPRTWFIAENDRGEVIAIRALHYQPHPTTPVTCGGVYIVKPHLRGLGVGRAVNTPALRAAGDGTVIISATDVNLYKKQGFVFDYSIHLKRVNVGLLQDVIPQITNNMKLSPYSDSMLVFLMKYDSTVTQHERSQYVRKWILGRAEAVTVARGDEGEITGYGCLRRTGRGPQISPLYADSVHIATSIMKTLLEKCEPTEDLDMFVPDGAEAMFNLLASLPHQNAVTLHKMWKGPHIDVQRKRVFSMSRLIMSIT